MTGMGTGLGQWVHIQAGNSYTLPVGGTWCYFFTLYLSGNSMLNSYSGCTAGGTLIMNSPTYNAQGFAWRTS